MACQCEECEYAQLWREVGQYIDKSSIGYGHEQIVAVFKQNIAWRQRFLEAHTEMDALKLMIRHIQIKLEGLNAPVVSENP